MPSRLRIVAVHALALAAVACGRPGGSSSGGGGGCNEPGASGSVMLSGMGQTANVSCFAAVYTAGSPQSELDVFSDVPSGLDSPSLKLTMAVGQGCSPASGQSISLVPPDGGINPCLVVVCGGWDAGSCGNVGTGQDVAGSVILDHWSTTPGDSVTMHFSSDASLGLLENQGGFQPLSVSGSFTAPVSAP